MPTELLEELKEIDASINELSKKRESVVRKIEENGYTFDKNGNIQKNEQTLGFFWDISYCDYYVGEHGMYTKEAGGAHALTVEEFNELANALQNKEDEYFEEASSILENITVLDDYVFSNCLNNGTFKFGENMLSWETNETGTNDGMMNPGSKFYVELCSLKKINDTIFHYEKDVAP